MLKSTNRRMTAPNGRKNFAFDHYNVTAYEHVRRFLQISAYHTLNNIYIKLFDNIFCIFMFDLILFILNY